MGTRCQLIFTLGWSDSPSTLSGSVEEVSSIRSHYFHSHHGEGYDDDDDGGVGPIALIMFNPVADLFNPFVVAGIAHKK